MEDVEIAGTKWDSDCGIKGGRLQGNGRLELLIMIAEGIGDRWLGERSTR